MGLREKIKGAGSPDSQRPPAPPRQEPLLDGAAHPQQTESISVSMVLEEAPAPQQAPPAPAPKHPQSVQPPIGQPDLSEGGVARMPPAMLLAVAVSELRSRRISDEDGFMDERALRPLYKAVVAKGLVGEVFNGIAQAGARAENPTREENAARQTKRPQPPPVPRRSAPPPRSLRVGSDAVTGEEATVVSDAFTPKEDGVPAAALAMLPPKGVISAFLESLNHDLKLTTEQRLQKLRDFQDPHLNVLHQLFGDTEAVKKVILAHQKSALAKRKRGEPLSRMEEHILDVTRLSNYVQKVENDLREEQKHADLRAKKRSNLPGQLQRIPSPDKDPAPPSARQQPARPPSPEAGQARSPSPERSKQAPPEQKRESEVPPEPETHKSRGRLARFMLSPVTWTAVCVGGFTAAMYATGGFDELGSFLNIQMARIPAAAPYIRRVWEGWLHLPPLESAAGAKALYYGLTGLGVSMGYWRKRRRVRRMVAELETGIQDHERFRKMRNYVVPILAEIYDNYREGTFPKKLRTKLIEDSRFFLYMDEIICSPAKFDFIMNEAEVPSKQRVRFHIPFGDAENEILKMRLEDYVHNIGDPGLRQTHLQDIYDRDPLFRKKLDEVFVKNAAGDYLNTWKQTKLAEALGSGEKEKGVPILERLKFDYMKLIERKQTR